MKILITGGAGGIGSTLGYYLHKKGHDLILVDNLRNGYLENLKIDGETFGSFYQIDINSIEFCDLVKEKNPEVVVHLAAITSLPDCEVNSAECIRINVEGTVSVIEACRKSGVSRIIFASTSAVYENTEVPLEAGFDESDDINPRLFYSLSKKMAEEICLSYIQNYGMDIIILRFFNVFGPKQDIHRKSPPLINYIVREFKKGRTPVLHSDGNQSRDYVHSEDVAEIIERCLKIQNPGERIFNVSSNTSVSVREVVSAIKKGIPQFSHTEEEYRAPEKLWDSYPSLFEGKFPLKREIVEKETNKKSVGKNALARKILGWNPNTKILDLIEKVSSQIDI